MATRTSHLSCYYFDLRCNQVFVLHTYIVNSHSQWHVCRQLRNDDIILPSWQRLCWGMTHRHQRIDTRKVES